MSVGGTGYGGNHTRFDPAADEPVESPGGTEAPETPEPSVPSDRPGRMTMLRDPAYDTATTEPAVSEPAAPATDSPGTVPTTEPRVPSDRPGRMTMLRDPAADTASAATATPAVAPPKASDLVPTTILEKHGLDPDKMTTESRYEGPQWNVGYYPYDGDVQYISFAKHAQVFGNGTADSHAYFENYSNPPGDLTRGSWVGSGYVSESEFEIGAGVDISGDRPVGNALYKAIREAGAPSDGKFAVLDAEGKELPFGPDDQLVPTLERDGKTVEVLIGGDGEYKVPGSDDYVDSYSVAWRIKRTDGTVDKTGDPKPRKEVLGVNHDVSFDFLDASGGMVSFNPPGDRMVEAFEDAEGKWHAFAKLEDGRFEHQVLDGDNVTQTETVDQNQKNQLTSSQELMYRVQNTGTGALKGDGKVNNSFDMSWWGKCHNVASIGTSNMERPKEAVQVVTNQEPGETLALRFGNNVLKRQDDGAYTHEVRDGDTVTSSNVISSEQAATLAKDNNAAPVIVRGDGSLKEAKVSAFSTTEIDALVAHIGDGAVVSKGGEGCRYYAHPDILVTKDGRQIQAHIKSVTTEGGKTEEIGSRSGTEYHERDRSPLRGPGMESRVLGNGMGRQYAFNVQDMQKLNEHREDDIKSFTVIHPDGHEETIEAANVELCAWENQFDFRPDHLWSLHETVTKDGSTVLEGDPGTHVWNYTINSVDTKPIDPKDLSTREQEAAAKPGMMTGTTEEEGKYYFRTAVDGRDYTYWARFDDDGNVADYAYLDSNVPDFVWTQHVKNAYDTTWSGESQAPGVGNGEIQRLYLASLGAFKDATLPGGFLGTADLKTATPKRPG
ncbi:hypothetical protein ACFL59_05755 [Planctomycetota bacterium]